MSNSRQIAQIVGPTMVALAVSEIVNWRIFATTTPALVYLNGSILFVAGVALVRSHNVWTFRWPLIVTLTGWALLAAGLYRLFFPEAGQAPGGIVTDIGLAILALIGLFLTYQAYLGRNDERRQI